MTLLRRGAYGALALAFAHIVFGAIVRITGSGLGCGDHWPTCHGYWFPPLQRMDLVIEVMHRYLAFGLSTTIVGLLVLALVRHREPGVGGPGGALRPIAAAAGLVVSAALLGGLVVKLELRNKAVIVVHLAIAVTTLAALALAAIRAGGLGSAQVVSGSASAKTWRAARVAAALAFAAVVLGGLTAHVVGANTSCVGFPHCPRGVGMRGMPLWVQLTHRAVAFLLLFHLLGMVLAVRKRAESALIQWAVRMAFGTVLMQIVVAAALVELELPPELRSLHQAVGTLVWLSVFVLAVLARRGSLGAEETLLPAMATSTVPEAGALRRAPVIATGAASVAATMQVPAPAAARETTSIAAALAPSPVAAAATVAEPALPEATAEEVELPELDAAPVVSIEPEVLIAMATGEFRARTLAQPVVTEDDIGEAATVVEPVAETAAEALEVSDAVVDDEPPVAKAVVVPEPALMAEDAGDADAADEAPVVVIDEFTAVAEPIEAPIAEQPTPDADPVQDDELAADERVSEELVAADTVLDEPAAEALVEEAHAVADDAAAAEPVVQALGEDARTVDDAVAGEVEADVIAAHVVEATAVAHAPTVEDVVEPAAAEPLAELPPIIGSSTVEPLVEAPVAETMEAEGTVVEEEATVTEQEAAVAEEQHVVEAEVLEAGVAMPSDTDASTTAESVAIVDREVPVEAAASEVPPLVGADVAAVMTAAAMVDGPVVEQPIMEQSIVEAPVAESVEVEAPVVVDEATVAEREKTVVEEESAVVDAQPVVAAEASEIDVASASAMHASAVAGPVASVDVEAPIEAEASEVPAPVETDADEMPAATAMVADSVVEQPIAEEPIAEQLVAEEPVVQETVAQESAVAAVDVEADAAVSVEALTVDVVTDELDVDELPASAVAVAEAGEVHVDAAGEGLVDDHAFEKLANEVPVAELSDVDEVPETVAAENAPVGDTLVDDGSENQVVVEAPEVVVLDAVPSLQAESFAADTMTEESVAEEPPIAAEDTMEAALAAPIEAPLEEPIMQQAAEPVEMQVDAPIAQMVAESVDAFDDVPAGAAVEPAAVEPPIALVAEVVEEPIAAAADEDEDEERVPDFDSEVAARLEQVVGRDPFEDDEDDWAAESSADDEELDADDDFAAAIAAAFGDEEEAEAEGVDDETTQDVVLEVVPVEQASEVPASEVLAIVEPTVEHLDVVAADVAVDTPVAIGESADMASIDAASTDTPEIDAVQHASDAPAAIVATADAAPAEPAVPADIAKLPSAPTKRPPTLAVLIARGADF